MQGVHVFWPVLPLGRQCTSGAAAGLKPPHEGGFHAASGTWSCWEFSHQLVHCSSLVSRAAM